jgi:hypothetical protein
MSRRIEYTNEPLGRLRVIRDFLPPPEALAFREEGVKVTIALSKYSVDFFKREAQKHGTQYQRMIRRLLDSYAQAHSQDRTTLASQRRRTRAPSL